MSGDITQLSKSKYCKGLQCPKILWLDFYKPEEAEDVLSETIMSNGNLVGDFARHYFGDYSLVDFSFDKEKMVKHTKEYMNAGSEVIAEAAFLADGLYCAVDIFKKDGDGWDIIEVKSSTKVSDIYIEDMAFQYHVLSLCGIKVNKVCIMYINNKYVRNGDIDLTELFNLEDYTDTVKNMCGEVEDKISSIREYISVTDEPQKDIGLYCDSPYECAYKKYCGKHIPKYSVFDLAGAQSKTKYNYYQKGIVSYEDILAHENEIRLSEKQLRQVRAVINNSPDEINADRIKQFLDTLSFPVYHLDFETFMSPIPPFDGTSPYQQIPFQYSLHIENEDGSLIHKEFLAEAGTDPRRKLAEQLVEDIPVGSCSLAYNMSFEKTVIKKLAEVFPDLAVCLMDIHDNLHDLMIPFKDHSYYSAAMNGSYSIKYVLPALYPDDPELNYHNLDLVHNGSEASASFADLASKSPEEIEDIRAALLKYCGLDTLAMVKVLAKLREAV